MLRKIILLLAITALSAPPEILPQNGFRAGWAKTSFQEGTYERGDGLTAASFITWDIAPRLLFQTELEFSVRRASIESVYLKDTLDATYTTRNLSLPLLLLTPVVGFEKGQTSIFAGISPGLNLGNSVKSSYITETSWNIPSLDLIAGLDTRIDAGEMALILDSRISWGLLEQVDGTRVWSFRLTAGYSFNL